MLEVEESFLHPQVLSNDFLRNWMWSVLHGEAEEFPHFSQRWGVCYKIWCSWQQFLLSCTDIKLGLKEKKINVLEISLEWFVKVFHMRGKKGRKQGRKCYFSVADEMCMLPLELEGFKCIHCFLLLLTLFFFSSLEMRNNRKGLLPEPNPVQIMKSFNNPAMLQMLLQPQLRGHAVKPGKLFWNNAKFNFLLSAAKVLQSHSVEMMFKICPDTVSVCLCR